MECRFCEKSLRGVIQCCVYGNVDVKNGAQCRFKGLILKIGAQHTKEQVNGLWALTANADDVTRRRVGGVCSVFGATVES